MKKFIKFSLLGGIGFFTGFATLFVLTNFFRVWYIFSSIIAELVNYFISFNIHKYLTFEDKDKQKTPKEMFLYFFVVFGYFIANTGLMYVLTDMCHIKYTISKIILMAAMSVPNYWATEKVFKKVKKKELSYV